MSTPGGVLPGWVVEEYGEYAGDGRHPLMPVVRRWLTPVNVVIAIATLIGLLLRLYQLTRPGSLSGIVEYDDGPYVGSAILLTHGILPYRDYIFVQPPGITLILFPIAMLARVGLMSTAAVMTTGRIITTLVSSVGVLLLGVLIRHRGIAAVTIGCGLLAVYTGSVETAHTVLLEPWVVMFCLLGAILVFDGDRLAQGRRLVWGGVVFGFAGVVEAFAIVPVLVITLLCLPRARRAARFVAGVAAGFLVPALPFALASPRGFYMGVITAQIGSRPNAIWVSSLYRFKLMTGLDWVHPWSSYETFLVMLALAGTVVVTMIIAWMISGRGPRPLDWFPVLVSLGIVYLFLSPSQFLYHFTAFFGPFLAMALALPLARFADAVHDWLPLRVNWPQRILAAAALPVLMVFTVMQARAMTGMPPWPAVPAEVQRIIPPGACVLSDTSPPLVMTDHLTSSDPRCIILLDSMGADLALSHGLKPDTGAWRVPAVQEMWWRAFRNAQFVWLRASPQAAPRVAWTPGLAAYFRQHFKVVLTDKFVFDNTQQSYTIYRRVEG